jgi:hypothetical protein
LEKNRFKPVWFFRFGSVFSGFLGFLGLAWFFWFGSVWFFRFQACKTETEPVGFFKFLIGFFHGLGFLIIFSV